jgi:hypothetical protein
MNKKIYLIPLLVIMLGVLVPVLYAAGQQGEEPSISANIQDAEENKTEDGDQKNLSEEEQEQAASAAAEEDSKDSGSLEAAASKPSNKESQNEQKSTSSDSQSAASKQVNQKNSSSDKKTSHPASSSQEQVEQKPAVNQIRVSVTIVDKNKNKLYSSAKVDLKEKGSVLDALYATGVSCRVRSDGYVKEIKGIAEDHTTGGGWMYSVNGGSPPGTGAANYTVQKGDSILWYYGVIGSQPPKL